MNFYCLWFGHSYHFPKIQDGYWKGFHDPTKDIRCTRCGYVILKRED